MVAIFADTQYFFLLQYFCSDSTCFFSSLRATTKECTEAMGGGHAQLPAEQKQFRRDASTPTRLRKPRPRWPPLPPSRSQSTMQRDEQRDEAIQTLASEERDLRAELERVCGETFTRWQECKRELETLKRQGSTADPPFIGLPNPMNYCFMNSAVQCLRHTPQLCDAITSAPFSDTERGLLPSFAGLLRAMDGVTDDADPTIQAAWTSFVGHCGELPGLEGPLVVPAGGAEHQRQQVIQFAPGHPCRSCL